MYEKMIFLATLFICWANIKSANASKEELAERKRINRMSKQQVQLYPGELFF